MSVGELADLTDRVAVNVQRLGCKPGAVLAMMMPMTAEAVAIYLGIIKAGCVVAGIADSFQPKEIASRLRLSNAAAVFTQDVILRGGRALPLYAKVIEASALPRHRAPRQWRRAFRCATGDLLWNDFLKADEANPGGGMGAIRPHKHPVFLGNHRRSESHSVDPDDSDQMRRGRALSPKHPAG